jgi:hypothetical protein
MNAISTEVQVPRQAEFDGTSEMVNRAGEQVELIGMRLGKMVADDLTVRMSGEEAFALPRLARSMRISAEWPLETANQIDDNADQIWNEQRIEADDAR